MKKKSLLFLFFLLIVSCNSVNDNRILLFNDVYFELFVGDKQRVLEERVKNNYLDLISNKEVQIPLFKHIKNKNYSLFIGLPYNTTLSKINQQNLFEESIILFSKKDERFFSFKSYKNKSDYVVEYVQKVDENLLYILLVSDYSESINHLSYFEELSKRIIK